jgi:DNA (cytosine-5)-methyltransferase 1
MRQASLPLPDELVVDNFAGGGGASIGIEAGIGRAVDVAINHDPEAIAMHRANHPDTRHFTEDVWKIDPVKVTGGQPVGLAWFSPDCKHFSKAKGRRPVSKKIRGLAWVVVRWARRVRPRVIMLENVEEFQDWGPVDENGIPCKKRKGQTFQQFVGQLERYGYRVEFRQLRACDYGAPTIRKRLFLVARRDGLPIVWPEPTHGDPNSKAVKSGKLKPWRSAAECIDWSIPCPSIFERPRPLADNTMKRIARGIQRFVLDDPDPFILRICQTGWGGDRMQYEITDPLTTITTKAEHCLVTPFITKFRAGSNGSAADEPLHTITAGGEQARPGTGNAMGLVTPYFIPRHGEREGQEPRCRSVEQPLPTITATANGASLVAAFMAQHNTGMVGHRMAKPVSTIVQKGCTQALVAAHLQRQFGNSVGNSANRPAGTITAGGGGKSALVAALMAPYYGSGSGLTGRDLRDPSPSITSRDRLQLVTVTIDDQTYVLEDIGMRMLQPHELYAAQGFPDDYVITHGLDSEGTRVKFPKYVQVRLCGNSVCPPLSTALVRANFQHEAAWKEVAA